MSALYKREEKLWNQTNIVRFHNAPNPVDYYAEESDQDEV